LLRERYLEKIGKINNLPELSMRSEALREVLHKLEPVVGCCWIDQMIRGTLWGRERDQQAILALSRWLIRARLGERDYDRIESLYRAAHEHDLEIVTSIFPNPPPHQELPDEGDLREARLPVDRDEVTVGERRSIARGSDRDYLQRLLLDTNPMVIANLLENPAINQSDVLKIASRRPTKTELLREVVLSDRWLARSKVRRALAFNPYNDTGISLRLLPTLGITALRNLQHGSDLHPALSEAAQRLVTLRERRTYPWEV